MLCISLLPPCLKYFSADKCSLKIIKTNCDEDFTCLHKSHATLKNLTFLSLKGNKLQHFPFKSDTDTESNSLIYPDLEWLDLSNNELCDQLSPSVGQQKHLRSLVLSGNRNLKSLPLELSYLSNTLSLLQVDGLSHITDSHLREYQSNQSSKELLKLFSYMKSAMKR